MNFFSANQTNTADSAASAVIAGATIVSVGARRNRERVKVMYQRAGMIAVRPRQNGVMLSTGKMKPDSI